ncbi:hypothetical protein ABFX02_12G040200 [Erythranthe guttata]
MITTTVKPSHCTPPPHRSILTVNKPHKQSLANPRSACVALSSFASSAETPKWDPNFIQFPNVSAALSNNRTTHNQKKEEDEEEEEEELGEKVVVVGGRKVKCEVEVISWRERRIKGEISVDSDVDSVWRALTDYERLADFIPNLVSSGRIPCPHPGRIWLEQRGLQRALYWHIEARVVLDLQEFLISEDDRELRFSMVDGDFKKFEGKWSVKSRNDGLGITSLGYEVNVIPRFNFPAIFLERIIRSDLPVNLHALACRSESNFESPLYSHSVESNNNIETELKNDVTSGDTIVKEKYVKASFGPLSPATNGESNSNWGIFGKTCSLDKPCMVDEVHLRRFDGLLENGGVHRCVVASITIKAPVREVWNILTAYESLPEIVPNLAISKVLSRENNKVRILQCRKGARDCCTWFCMHVLYLIYARISNKRFDSSKLKETLILFEGNGFSRNLVVTTHC